ncbi:MAG: glycosyl hydrolase [Ruminococcaceae bacterium]|nr:glycosyl hydrolase [Oscillospiraceae bacterium]
MTLGEKISLCSGKNMWHSKALERYGIPSFMMADGPHGLRCQRSAGDMLGINRSLPATCFPTAVTAGASWNRALLAREGNAIAREAAAAGVSVLLGPGCNIKRHPLCGRNFEYFSEDPFLAGELAAAFVQGVQQSGVSACVKHFAVNNQEYKRMNGNSRLDERTLREIYLAPFEKAVKQGKTDTVMCSYNKINGTHASDHRELLTDILRREWGFAGAVITDWGALNDRAAAFAAGCDLAMPGGSAYQEKEARAAVRRGALCEEVVNASAARVMHLAKKSEQIRREPVDREAHHALALQVALQGAVLLKNEGGLLPLEERDAVLIGRMAAEPRYQGSGSSHINPTRLVSIREAMPHTPCFPCGDARGNVSEQEIETAARMAAERPVAVVAVGLPEHDESEGIDRAHMRLPEDHCRLVEAVARANSHTVVVLFGGGVMELPFAERVGAILFMGLPGQAGGAAVAELLTGRACPSGKLTESWPFSLADVVADSFGEKDPAYREGIYVGYRYYETAEKAVRYPFGHGLSYTSFAYSDLRISGKTVQLFLENTGTCRGAAVVQLYIAPQASAIHRPARELKEFARVELEPGERKEVTFVLDRRSFALWRGGWQLPSGKYTVEIGSSVADIRLRKTVTVIGNSNILPPYPQEDVYAAAGGIPTKDEWERWMQDAPDAAQTYTMDSTCLEMGEHSRVIRSFERAVEFAVGVLGGGLSDPYDPTYLMVRSSALDAPLRAMVQFTGGIFGKRTARWLLHLANGGKKKSNKETE